MTAPRPKTPLPWKEVPNCAGCDECLSDVEPLDLVDPEFGIPLLEKEDAAYIAHSANNYPALVAAMWRVIEAPKGSEQEAFDGLIEALKAAGEL